MTDRSLADPAAGGLGLKASIHGPIAAAALLFLAGIGGWLTEAWGYGLFLVATLLLLAGILVFAVFVLSKSFDGEHLTGTYRWLLVLGGWCYVFAVAALGGFFVHETFAGRMEWQWILFGPSVLAALVVLDVGLYRLLVGKNRATWERYGHVISREGSDPAAMRRTLMDDVIMHRSLRSVSGFRWLKHTLIFWGFGLMFLVEVVAVFLREGIPAFGLYDFWEDLGHPVRMAFDFAFDFTGMMILVGCILALVWRLKVNGTELQKFSDTPTAVFLLFVVVSGFLVEAIRIAEMGATPVHAASFAGYAAALAVPGLAGLGGAPYEALWLIHVLGSCAFIAYVPVKRLVHSCATPMGRLMNSQKGLLAAKKEASLKGLMAGKRP